MGYDTTGSLIFSVMLLIICACFWVGRIKKLFVMFGGTEREGQIVGFAPYEFSMQRYEGWGYRYTTLVKIKLENGSVCAESVEKVFAPTGEKPEGIGDEVTVIYNPKSGRCILNSFAAEIFFTLILTGVTAFFVYALIYDIGIL
ncbi:MAG: hypothetical protein J6K92_08995 [Oscillospiraceae bacterium]|nr:hypothetical protein [Oscillospiraceae bacterium]